MSTYKNGPGNVPRLPERVVDCLINSAGVSCLACGPRNTAIDQTANVERLVHEACEELLARLPAAPVVAEGWVFPTFEDWLASPIERPSSPHGLHIQYAKLAFSAGRAAHPVAVSQNDIEMVSGALDLCEPEDQAAFKRILNQIGVK